jgi:DNA repair protein RecO (recombination protein O)
MPLEKTQAIVLRVIEFSESSCVVTLFTRDFGKVGALAKGARRPKSAFDSALDLLSVCRIVFLPKSSEALDLLTEARLERRFRLAGRSLPCLYAGYYVAELLNELTHEHDPHPELFDAAVQALAGLDQPGAAPLPWVVRFELTSLQILGHLPSLEVCVECGSAVEPTARVAFGLTAGGVLCAKCRPGQRHVVTISGGTLRVMQCYSEKSGQTWQRLQLEAQTRAELRGVLGQYIAHLMGRPPRMQAYLPLLASEAMPPPPA